MVYPHTDGAAILNTNPAAHSGELNWRAVDHKSDALTTTLPSHPLTLSIGRQEIGRHVKRDAASAPKSRLHGYLISGFFLQ